MQNFYQICNHINRFVKKLLPWTCIVKTLESWTCIVKKLLPWTCIVKKLLPWTGIVKKLLPWTCSLCSCVDVTQWTINLVHCRPERIHDPGMQIGRFQLRMIEVWVNDQKFRKEHDYHALHIRITHHQRSTSVIPTSYNELEKLSSKGSTSE